MTIPQISEQGRRVHICRLKPVHEAMGEATVKLTELLLKRFQLPYSGPKARGYRAMVSSIIRTALEVSTREAKEKEKPKSKRMMIQLGMSVGNDNWARFPLVGSVVGMRVLKSFVSNGLLIKDQRSGRREFYTTANGKLAYKAIMTSWSVTPDFKKLLRDAPLNFSEAGVPLLVVNKIETRVQKELRKLRGEVKQKLTEAEKAMLFGSSVVAKHHLRLAAIASFWQQHPLILPDGNAATSASRIFSDSSLTVGGRLYGAWTNLKSEDRLKCTIGAEPVLQLDISASQPTLLSVLLGERMKDLSPENGWYDPYTQLTQLWSYGQSSVQSSDERDRLNKRARNIAKKVTMEVIGTGNIDKALPSSELVEELKVTKEEWDFFKAKLVEAIPALKKLEPRYDKKGQPTGYLNGSGFLSFHESEIMLRTLEILRDEWNIPAYPVHDCLLVKRSDWEPAYAAFVSTICTYVEEMTGTKVIVPIKREGGGLLKIKFRGVYDSSIPQHLFG
jgi:hypothetical protein